MDSKYELRETHQNNELEIRGKIKRNVEKIFFDVVINMLMLVFLMHAVVSAYLARSDPLKMALDSSPFLALALSFICAKTIYHKFGAQKEIILPLFRSIESKMKSPEAEERALTVLALIMLSIFFVYVAIELPETRWHMKVWVTINWMNMDIQFIISEMYHSATDIKGKRRMAAAASVGLTILSTQFCYLMVMFFLSLKWIVVCTALTFGCSFPLWLRFALNLNDNPSAHNLLNHILAHQIPMPAYEYTFLV